MSSEHQSRLTEEDLKKLPSAEGLDIHIVVSEWNAEITDLLLQGAESTLVNLGLAKDDIHILKVPGTFELPVAAKILLKNKKNTDAVICLGCVVKGETDHDIYINQSVANALNQLSIISGTPIIFGVLTTNTQEQALDRVGGAHGHKGVEAAITAVKMAQLSKEINKPGKSIGF